LKRSPLVAEVYRIKEFTQPWAVEARHDSGVIDLTVFYGSSSRHRALEYAHAKFEIVKDSDVIR
jgi:hypothetical protein